MRDERMSEFPALGETIKQAMTAIAEAEMKPSQPYWPKGEQV